VAIVAFLSLRAGLLEGAAASYAVGYLLDLMTGRPTGLYTLLAVVTFLLGRIAAGLVDVRSGRSFALFAMAADATHGVLAWGIASVSSKQVSVSRAVRPAAGGAADRAGRARSLPAAEALRPRRREA
jgi:rod shape-determining protein MreD